MPPLSGRFRKVYCWDYHIIGYFVVKQWQHQLQWRRFPRLEAEPGFYLEDHRFLYPSYLDVCCPSFESVSSERFIFRCL